MTRIQERIETGAPIEAAFDYIADFAHAAEWDPGTTSSRRIDAGEVGSGARFVLDVRMGGRTAPMEYRITDFERPHRVVLVGEGSGVESVDDIRFERVDGKTVVDYRADIKLGGFLGLIQPLLGGAFRTIGRNAAAGMERELATLARRADHDGAVR